MILLITSKLWRKTLIRAIKQKGIVGKQGKIELDFTGLDEGTEVKVIIFAPSSEIETTEYLSKMGARIPYPSIG